MRTNVEISSPSSSSLRHHKHGDPISHSDDGHESERDAYSLECSNSRKSSSRKQSSQCQTPAEESSSSEQTTRANSPSLEDLEQVKKNLILQLKDDSDVTPSLSDGSSREVPHAGILSNDNGDDLKSSKNVGNVSVTETNKVGKSKSMHLGSPAIIQLSKGMCMPSPEKFAVGVSEHIPFENLPDSAGQYKRMKGVIQKIREKNKAKF